MFRIVLEKELKTILLSPKFATTFAICSLLILLSAFIGIREYRAAERQYDTLAQLTEQQMQEENAWRHLANRAQRRPDPMQVFITGVNNDIGRYSIINDTESVKYRNSAYSDDPIFAMFRFVDLTFVFQVVLSLFAILFTYNSISGEKEDGTLRLTFANAVPRAAYILAKFCGTLLALLVPLLIPLLLATLLVMTFGIPLTALHWQKLAMFLAISLLFFASFAALGLMISTLTGRASVAFLVALVCWVLFVFVVPRASVMAAGQLVAVPSTAEIEGQQDGFAKQLWEKHKEELQTKWRDRNTEMAGMNKEERDTYQDDHSWGWMQEDEAARKQIQRDIEAYSEKLQEEVRSRKAAQERLAMTLTRLSPSSAYQLAAMNLAGTDVALKNRYENAGRNYRKLFTQYLEQKQQETGERGGIQVFFDSEGGFKINLGRDAGALDLRGLPRFEAPTVPVAEALAAAIPDFGLLALQTLLAFAVAFVAFLRYDLR